jgi:hypothetical protein
MRIKIIGDNNCARATRHLLRLAGFAVTEFLPVEAITSGPHAGYAITIDLAPATNTPDSRLRPPNTGADYGGLAHLRPDSPAHHHHASASEEADRLHRDASSPAFVRPTPGRTTAGKPAFAEAAAEVPSLVEATAARPPEAPANFRSVGGIHFDSVDSALEAAVLRHVAQLAAAPVIVDRPGGVVHSDRELRIVAPNTGDLKADEAAAVAIEFGVLRGLLDLTAPAAHKKARGKNTNASLLNEAPADRSAEAPAISRSEGGKRKWWLFGVLLLVGGIGLMRVRAAASPARVSVGASKIQKAIVGLPAAGASFLRGGLLVGPNSAGSLAFVGKGHRLKPVLLLAAAEPQGQFATGQGIKITDGNNFLVVDPCKAAVKSYASISQTANAQLVTGTASKKIYVCSIHVVTAVATNVAVVEGTGTVCGTSTAGVGGFGGATAATGWNFAANGGIALGNGDSSVGAEGTSGDNLCIFNSGSGQVSGGISYVVQ